MSDPTSPSSRSGYQAEETGASTGEERMPPEVIPGGTGSIPLVPHRPGRHLRRTNLAARGEPMVWLTGGCIATAVLMILGLLAYIAIQGFSTFWPQRLTQLQLADGDVIMGELSRADELVLWEGDEPVGRLRRVLYKTGNFDITGEDFRWVREDEVVETSYPEWGLVVERLSWGNAYGTLEAVVVDGERTEDPQEAWAKFQEIHPQMEDLRQQVQRIEKRDVGRIAREQDEMRLALRRAARLHGPDSPEYAQLQARQEARTQELEEQFEVLRAQIEALEAEMARYRVAIRAPTGEIIPENRARPDEPMLIAQVVRAYPANQLGLADKLGVYFSRWGEFLTDDPREANAEGGIFPAIVGTVLLTFIMIIFVVPLGVIAAIYLREYARQGAVVSIVRISVNNLAGVPSIVYGVFGLGFFSYGVGAWIDGGPRNPMTPEWWTTLAIGAAGLVGAAIVLGVLGRRLNVNSLNPEGSRRARLVGVGAFVLWVSAVGLLFLLVARMPFFGGFYQDRLPDPTVGKSAMIWASLTLAILTLPVVIVATEEALAAVPRSMREGSYACGASKWQTIRRIVLPRALPGIMTGMILAIARGAGEVAPLMLVGAVKLAPELPIALEAPWFGSDRSFMHLGFHIFDLGFQSRNSEAARGMVYTTTLLLIAVVVTLNVAAILVRSRLRRTYAGGQF